MEHRSLRLLTLVLAALGLAPGAAHLLEMPVKLGYTPELYATVTSTLYAFFGSAGAAIQIAGLASAAVLAFVFRQRPGFRLAASGALLLALSLVIWGVTVAPVNAEWKEATQSASQSLPGLYAKLRLRWELGHVAAFVAWFAGYGVLQWFALGGHATARHGRRAEETSSR